MSNTPAGRDAQVFSYFHAMFILIHALTMMAWPNYWGGNAIAYEILEKYLDTGSLRDFIAMIGFTIPLLVVAGMALKNHFYFFVANFIYGITIGVMAGCYLLDKNFQLGNLYGGFAITALVASAIHIRMYNRDLRSEAKAELSTTTGE